jgi:hypothetical protein
MRQAFPTIPTGGVATITGGSIDNTPIGASVPSTIQGTTIVATVGFSGPGTGLTDIPASALADGSLSNAELLTLNTLAATSGTMPAAPISGQSVFATDLQQLFTWSVQRDQWVGPPQQVELARVTSTWTDAEAIGLASLATSGAIGNVGAWVCATGPGLLDRFLLRIGLAVGSLSSFRVWHCPASTGIWASTSIVLSLPGTDLQCVEDATELAVVRGDQVALVNESGFGISPIYGLFFARFTPT